MIKFKLGQLIAQKEYAEGRSVMLKEICEATGIHRSSLNRMVTHKPHNIGCEIIDHLCRYFDCSVSDLMEYVPHEPEHTAASKPSASKKVQK